MNTDELLAEILAEQKRTNELLERLLAARQPMPFDMLPQPATNLPNDVVYIPSVFVPHDGQARSSGTVPPNTGWTSCSTDGLGNLRISMPEPQKAGAPMTATYTVDVITA